MLHKYENQELRLGYILDTYQELSKEDCYGSLLVDLIQVCFYVSLFLFGLECSS